MNMTSVYDFDPFANSPFAETVNYTTGITAKDIKVVVFRNEISKIQNKTDVPVPFYKYHMYINRKDIPQIIVGEDRIVMLDNDGVSKTFRVQAIISSDPGCFKVGVN